MNSIPTEVLTLDQVPAADASVEEMNRFAHTFDGYEHSGSFERCADIANARDHCSLVNLRTCLFFEARRLRHTGEELDVEEIAYWRELVSGIRREIQGKR